MDFDSSMERLIDTEGGEPITLNNGDCYVTDVDWLDVASESEGVLALQWSIDTGLWALYGETVGHNYRQVWRKVGTTESEKSHVRTIK